MNNEAEIFEALRLSQVKRWPICYTNRDQSVAEHSFGVLQIAMHLTRGEHDGFRMKVMEHAIGHDLNEIYSGDIPSGFKRRLRSEHPEITKTLDGTKPEPVVAAIVKLADYLEAIYYVTEFGGSRFTRSVLVDIKNKFADAIKEMSDHAEIGQSPALQRAMQRARNMYQVITEPE